MFLKASNILKRFSGNLILLILSLIILFLTYNTGLRLGLDTASLSIRYNYQALPMVLSEFHGKQHDYTAFSSTSDLFKNFDKSINSLVQQAQITTPSLSEPLRFIVGDDKGLVDFTLLAFKAFGYKQESLYKLFFVFLFVSTLIFSIQNFKCLPRMVLLFSTLLSLYVVGFTFVTQQANSFVEPRVFGILSIISLLHLLLVMTDREKLSMMDMLCTTSQAIMIAFIYHTRSSEVWQILSLVTFFTFLSIKFCRAPISSKAKLQIISSLMRPIIILFIVLGFLKAYTIFTYHPAYFDHYSAKRVHWHNMLIGTSLHPAIRKEYNLVPCDDYPVMLAVGNYLKLSNDDAKYHFIFDNFDPKNDHYRNFNFVEYEKVARALYFEILVNYPFEILELYAKLIPKTFISSVGYLAAGEVIFPEFFFNYDMIDLEKRDKQNLYYKPFRLEAVYFILFIIIVLLYVRRDKMIDFKPIFFPTVVAFIFSLIPPILATPTMWYIQPSLMLSSMLLYLTTIFISLSILHPSKKFASYIFRIFSPKFSGA